MVYLDYLDLLEVLSPPDLDGGGVEGVASARRHLIKPISKTIGDFKTRHFV